MGGLFSFFSDDQRSTTARASRVLVSTRANAAKVLPEGASSRVDYDAEGERLLKRLSGASTTDRLVFSVLSAVLGDVKPDMEKYHDVDVMWKHPETGALLYVGNDRAARNDKFLTSLKVSSIVNCTRPSKYGQLEDYHKTTGRYSYYDIPMGHWQEYCVQNSLGYSLAKEEERFEAALRFLLPAFSFVLKSLKQSRNVLVHCLAGAHRAGTMGILLLMHLQGMNADCAIKLAKNLRPIIEPISDFPLLLALYEKAIAWRCRNAGLTGILPAWNLPQNSAINSTLENVPSSTHQPFTPSYTGGGGGSGSNKLNRSNSAAEFVPLASARRPSIDNTAQRRPSIESTAQRRPSLSNASTSLVTILGRSDSFASSSINKTPRRSSVIDNTPDATPRDTSSFSTAYHCDVMDETAGGGAVTRVRRKPSFSSLPPTRRSYGPDNSSQVQEMEAVLAKVRLARQQSFR